MTTAQTSSPTACATAPSAAQVEASCRLPVLFLAFSGMAWLLFGAVLALLASVQLYHPTFMEGCAWVTYGRLRPAAVNALAYGFALQSAFALALWLIARLGRVELVAPLGLTAAAKFWNIGVTVGVFGILAGDATGFDLLEFPLYAALPLFASYACLAAWAFVTLRQRTERELYVSLWFVVAALLWFPWILSTAQGLLLGWRPSGVVQAVVAGWFGQNLLQLVLTGSAFAVLFYFVPKAVNCPLANPGLARAGFWLLLLLGGWGGLAQLPAVPGWIPAVSGAANFLVVVPVLALLASLWQTADGRISDAWNASAPFRFLAVAAVLLLGITLRTAFLGGHAMQFTFFATARTDIVLLGVFGLAALGALHYVVPRLTTGDDELPSAGLTDLTFWAALLGVVGVGIGFSLAGFTQAGVNADASKDFLKDGVASVAGNLKLVTAGYAALIVAALAFLLNFGLAVRRACAACCGGAR
ncbi:MAG: cbb3-type cytochrome c oxidase subunit I [Limisphaerales bacterium]